MSIDMIGLAACYKDEDNNWDPSKWSKLKGDLEYTPLPYMTGEITLSSLEEMQRYAALATMCLYFLDWAILNGIEEVDGINVFEENDMISRLITSQANRCQEFFEDSFGGNCNNISTLFEEAFGPVCKYSEMQINERDILPCFKSIRIN